MRKWIILLTLLFSNNSIASWTGPVKINEVIAEGPETGSSFILILNESVGVDPSVGTCQGTYHYLNASTEKGKMLFSMALTAKATGQTVRVDLIQGGSTSRCAIAGMRF